MSGRPVSAGSSSEMLPNARAMSLTMPSCWSRWRTHSAMQPLSLRDQLTAEAPLHRHWQQWLASNNPAVSATPLSDPHS